MLFRPTLWVKNVFSIDEEFLAAHCIKGLILDLDNTLSMHGSPAAEEGIYEWLADMRRLGVKMMVVSNNTEKRVTPLAKKLGLSCVVFGCKPLPFGINLAIKRLDLPKRELAVVGDQIFTDVIGGNSVGVRTILVEPFHLEDGRLFKIKRKAENLVFRRDYTKLT